MTARTILSTIVISLGFLLAVGCGSGGGQDRAAATEQDHATDKGEIGKLLRQVYQWQDTHQLPDGFSVTGNDTMYTGVDLAAHARSTEALRKTGYFSEEFLQNYYQLGVTMDKGLREGSLVWPVGELPGFGTDTSPWCNCQDNPDKFWEHLTLDSFSFTGDSASFVWRWDTTFSYRARARKAGGVWQIAYLNGFDPAVFF